MRRRFESALLEKPGVIGMNSLPLREPAPGEVRIRVEGCGICGSSLPVWDGRPWFRYPLQPGAPGHEGWGVVDEAGSDVNHVRAGDRVSFLSERSFAEYDFVDARSVVVLPRALGNQPFPGEALGCAMNVFARSDVMAGQRVAVVGVGFLGAVLVQLLAGAGATVYAISRRESSLEVAKRMGAHEVIPMDGHDDVIDAVRSLTGDGGCERVIEVTGHQRPLDLAGELTAERGRLVIAGYHQDGPRQVNMQMWNWRGIDVINAHERDPAIYVGGMKAAALAVEQGKLDPSPLYTDRFQLHELGAGLDALKNREGGFMKGLVTL